MGVGGYGVDRGEKAMIARRNADLRVYRVPKSGRKINKKPILQVVKVCPECEAKRKRPFSDFSEEVREFLMECDYTE